MQGHVLAAQVLLNQSVLPLTMLLWACRCA